jgi:PKD repeat protein
MKLRTFISALIVGAIMLLTGACESEDDKDQINAVFSYVADGFKVNFTDFSENAKEYTWDFGDGSEGSTKANPVHIYREKGEHLVSLTVANETGSSTFVDTVFVSGPNIKIDGDFTDWEYVPYTLNNPGNEGGTLLAVKTFASPDRINFYFEGTPAMNMAIIDLYIDADNNPGTGFSAWMYPAGSGADYLIEGAFDNNNPDASEGAMYRHTAPDNGWGWEAAYTFGEALKFSKISSSDGKNIIEFSVARMALGPHKGFINFAIAEMDPGWTQVGQLPVGEKETSVFAQIEL